MAIDQRIEGKPHLVGTISVTRLLPVAKRRMIGPFAFFDHMGPTELAPGVGFDVRPHPHIGLSTVTYFLAGENTHRDSLGTVQRNVPGDLNLMTAGGGVVHSERADPDFRARGGLMHGVQIWLALPDANEDDAASFHHHAAATLPTIALADGARATVLIGEAFGAASPVAHPSKPLLVELVLPPNVRVAIDRALATEMGLFVIEGAIAIGDETVSADIAAVIEATDPIVRVSTSGEGARVFVLGGEPLPPRFIEWNFVASSRARIDAAKAKWRAQAYPKIPGDDQEWIPLPDDVLHPHV